MIARWATDNFDALMHALYERALSGAEAGDLDATSRALLEAKTIDQQYRSVLREDEKIESEYFDRLVELARSR